MTDLDLAEVERLPDALEASTERMANQCSVDVFLWSRHSNNCLDAARIIRSLLSALKAERERVKEMEAALKPFAALLDTESNGYESAPDYDIVRSVGTLGRDYAAITVADLRRACAALGGRT